MTTRSYARTTRDAFKGLDYSCALERPAKAPYSPVLWLVMVVGAVIAIIAGLT